MTNPNTWAIRNKPQVFCLVVHGSQQNQHRLERDNKSGSNLNLEGGPFSLICYNSGMSKPEAKTPVTPATPNPKAFTGIKRVEVKVLKPGAFNPTEAVYRQHER